MGRRSGRSKLVVVAMAVLLLPVAGKSQIRPVPSSQRAPAPVAKNPEGQDERLRLLEERYATLKNEYASRSEELAKSLDRLAESMVLLGEQRNWKEEKKKLLADNKKLRELAASLEGQLKSAESLRRQIESELLKLDVESKEQGALISVAARDLSACDADGAVLRQDLDLRSAKVTDLDRNVVDLKKKVADLEIVSRQAAADSASLLAPLEKDLQEQRKVVASQGAELEKRGQELAKLKRELDEAKSQAVNLAKEKQAAVASLRDEKENQSEITKKLVRKVRENTTRLMESQSQLISLEAELNTLRGNSMQDRIGR